MKFLYSWIALSALFVSACANTATSEPTVYRGDGSRAIAAPLGLNEFNSFRFVDKWRISHRWLSGPIEIKSCMEGGNPFRLIKGFNELESENRAPVIEMNGRLYRLYSDYKGELSLSQRNDQFYGTPNNRGRENEFQGYTAVCEHFFRDTLDGVGLSLVKPDPAKGTDEWIRGAEPVMVNGLRWLRKTEPIRDWWPTRKEMRRDTGPVEIWVFQIPDTIYWLRLSLYSGTGETNPYKHGAFHYPEKHKQIVDLFHQMVESVTLEPITPVDIPATIRPLR